MLPAGRAVAGCSPAGDPALPRATPRLRNHNTTRSKITLYLSTTSASKRGVSKFKRVDGLVVKFSVAMSFGEPRVQFPVDASFFAVHFVFGLREWWLCVWICFLGTQRMRHGRGQSSWDGANSAVTL